MIRSGATPPRSTYSSRELRPGHTLDGPAIVDQGDTTIFVPAEWSAHARSPHTIRLEAPVNEP